MGTTNFQDIIGNYKKFYPKGWKDNVLPPRSTYVYSETDFSKGLGEKVNFPVVLGYPQSFSFPGTADTSTNYATSVSSVIKMAEADGYRFNLTVDINEKMITRAQASEGAFKRIMGVYHTHLLLAGTRMMEEMCIDGQSSRGRVTSSTNVDTTTTWVNFTDGYWSGGKWFFKQNGYISFFNASDNSAVGQDANKYQIIGYDSASKRIKVTGSANDISDLDTFLATTTDADIYPFGVYVNGSYNEFAGVRKFASNASTLFGLNAANYAMWNGSVQTLASTINFNKIIQSIAEFTDKEFEGDLALCVNPLRWADILNDQAALRRYDKQITVDVSNGGKRILFASENGTVEIVGHNKVMERQGLIFPKKGAMMRVGSIDLQIEDPQTGESIYKLPDSDDYRMVLRNDQVLTTNEVMYFKMIDDIRSS